MSESDTANCLAAAHTVAEALKVDPAHRGTVRLAAALGEPMELGTTVMKRETSSGPGPVAMGSPIVVVARPGAEGIAAKSSRTT